jgi:DNA-binding transcriptional MocR family regulator
VRPPREADSLEIYKKARKQGVSVLPGRLCSTRENFRRCLRLSFGAPFSPEIERGVKLLGKILGETRGG